MPRAIAYSRVLANLTGLPDDEAKAVALLALCEAADKWDPAKGPLWPYAKIWIHGAIFRARWRERRGRSGPTPQGPDIEAAVTLLRLPRAVAVQLGDATGPRYTRCRQRKTLREAHA